MKPKTINLCVLLPTYNRHEMINKCLLSIAKQTNPPKEVIILDQGRLDKTLIGKWRQSLLPTKLVYKHLKIRGRTRALNVGVKMAKSEFISVIDDDCYAHSKWAHYLTKTISNQEKTIITGRVLPGKSEGEAIKVRDYVVDESPKIYKKGNFITPIFIFSGANSCFKKRDFYDIGEFNPLLGVGADFKSADDVEWSYRALSKNYKIYYEPKAIVIHRSWRNQEEDIKTMENYGYGAGAFIELIFPQNKIDPFYYIFKILKWLFYEIVKSLITFKNPTPYLKYLSGFIAGFLDMKKTKTKNLFKKELKATK